jgi:hypothetical protein
MVLLYYQDFLIAISGGKIETFSLTGVKNGNLRASEKNI